MSDRIVFEINGHEFRGSLALDGSTITIDGPDRPVVCAGCDDHVPMSQSCGADGKDWCPACDAYRNPK